MGGWGGVRKRGEELEGGLGGGESWGGGLGRGGAGGGRRQRCVLGRQVTWSSCVHLMSLRLACLSSDPYHRSTADALSHR